MEILVTLLMVVTLVNTVLLIAIAGSVVKVVKSLTSSRSSPPRISRQRRYLDVEDRTPTYADFGVMGPMPEGVQDRPPNWDGVTPKNRNWDGLPREEE